VANYPFRHPDRVLFNPFNSNEIWVTNFGGGLRVGSTTSSFVLGDTNGDGVLNNFDIAPFELRLTNPAAYTQQFPTVGDWPARGDINHDGVFNNFDISPFEQLLTSGASSASSAEAAAPLATMDGASIAKQTVVPPGVNAQEMLGERPESTNLDQPLLMVLPLSATANSTGARGAVLGHIFSAIEETLTSDVDGGPLD
jgi:hypothetical protein